MRQRIVSTKVSAPWAEPVLAQYAKRMPGKKRPLLDQTTFPVRVMSKTEIGPKGELRSFRNPSKPLGETATVRWSSLAPLGGG